MANCSTEGGNSVSHLVDHDIHGVYRHFFPPGSCSYYSLLTVSVDTQCVVYIII